MKPKTHHIVTSALLIVVVVLLVPLVTVLLFKDGLYYPHLVVSTSGTVDTEFLFDGRRTGESCERLVENISQGIIAACPACEVKEKHCQTALEPAQRRVLSSDPLAIPSSRLPDGVVLYRSSHADVALSACMESERQSLNGRYGRVTCFAPSVVRPFTVAKERIKASAYFAAGWFAIVSGAICWLACLLLVRYQRFHGHLSMDGVEGGPQKFHAVATPRIGGVAILIGLLFTGAGLVPIEQRFSIEEYGYFILAALPAFAGGFAEDITKRIGVLPRLACTMVAAALCAWFLAAVIRRLDLPYVDPFLLWTPLAIAFTVFAVSGVANAINIIDGYNGLVAGYSILVLAAIAWVAAQVGDIFILTAALSMAGAMIGFFLWNYPKGKIFLGDGGAYFLGFWIAELSVLLVARHTEVSAWFPLTVLVYPIFETLYSIYRKKVLRGSSPGTPDGLHLHMCIYKRLVRVSGGGQDAKTYRNSLVSPYVWMWTAMFIGAAAAFWRHSLVLAIVSIIFCLAYLALYKRLLQWKTPKFLIVRKHFAGTR